MQKQTDNSPCEKDFYKKCNSIINCFMFYNILFLNKTLLSSMLNFTRSRLSSDILCEHSIEETYFSRGKYKYFKTSPLCYSCNFGSTYL